MRKYLTRGLLCAVLTGSSALTLGAYAATITVTSANDSGPGSLREAVLIAASGDEIRFAPALDGVALRLNTGQIAIDKDLVVTGRGTTQTLIQGPGVIPNYLGGVPNRILAIASGVSVAIAGVSFSGGFVNHTTTPGGAAILNQGTLAMTNCLLTRNTAWDVEGGGIYNSGGVLIITDTQFLGNSIDSNNGRGGGGIYNNAAGVAYITDCVFSGQGIPKNSGGGIYNEGTMTISSSRFEGNLAWTGGGAVNNAGGTLRIFKSFASGNGGLGAGGAILNSGALVIEQSVFMNNFTDSYGGGIANSGEAVIINSTLWGNESYRSGGAIDNYNGTLSLSHVTIAGNFARDSYYHHPHPSGGINNETGPTGVQGVVNVRNSMIIGNYSTKNDGTAGRSTPTDCLGNFMSEGYNIVGSLDVSDQYHDETSTLCSGFSQRTGDLVDVAVHDVSEYRIQAWVSPPIEVPLLGENAGTWPTVALISNSLARDTVPLNDCTDFDGNPLTTDQRGTLRPQGSACDIGAFEFSPPRDTLFWMQQCREKNSAEYSSEQLGQLFATISEKSSAFPGCALATCEALEPDSPRSSWKDKAARELLGAWLNLASGRLTEGRPIELVGLTSATTVGAAVAEIEATICNPDSTRQDLSHARDIAQALNESSDNH